jgi:hypothetical protein
MVRRLLAVLSSARSRPPSVRWGQDRACAVQSAGQLPWWRFRPQVRGSAQPCCQASRWSCQRTVRVAASKLTYRQRRPSASPCRSPSARATLHPVPLRWLPDNPLCLIQGQRLDLPRLSGRGVHQGRVVAGDVAALHRDLERARQDPVDLQHRRRGQALGVELSVEALQLLGR